MSTKSDTADVDNRRFQGEAHKYAAYLETPEGRLRLDLAFANLKEFLPLAAAPLNALDIGAGTGALALRLAGLGFQVTLLDSSLPMLEIAKLATQKARQTERIELKHSSTEHLTKSFPERAFDVIVCHNVLEFVENPSEVLGSAAQLMRDSSSILSILVRNRAGEVLKAGLQTGDLVAAANAITAERGNESLYGGSVRLFTPPELRTMFAASSLEVVAERGVRVISDYLPPSISPTAEYDRIFELERKLGIRPEFAAIARYTHCLARRADSITRENA